MPGKGALTPAGRRAPARAGGPAPEVDPTPIDVGWSVNELNEDSPRFLVAIDEAVAVKVAATGPDPERDRIIQVTLFHLDFSGMDVRTEALKAGKDARGTVDAPLYRTEVNPGMPTPERALRTHGLRQADLGGAPRFEEIAHEVRVFIGNLPLVGGDTLERDRAFLSAELKRAGVDPLDRNPCTTVYHHRMDAYGEEMSELADKMERNADEAEKIADEMEGLAGRAEASSSLAGKVGCLVLVIGIFWLIAQS